MLIDVYKCVQLNRCSVVCGCVLQSGERGSGFRQLCVCMKLGWDFEFRLINLRGKLLYEFIMVAL